MRRLVLAAGSLVADFELAHGGLARTELDEQIARSPFTRTWALYQRVAAPEETLGPRAAPPAALQDSESFASLDVEEPPAVLRRGTPEVATMVAHEARAPALQRVGTPEEPRVGLVATTHRVRLDGDAWARVLEACPDLLKQEFTSDVCDATSLPPPTSMRRLVLAAGSLVADFELAHGGLARTELDEQIARSPFTRTWALYQRVAAPEETLAPRCAACRPSGLRELRVTGRRGAAGCAAAGGTPEVATMVAHEARAPALQRVGTPEEPRVGLVATTHRVRLDGDAWARVLEACPDLLKREFTSDVCDATSLPPTSMRRLVLAAGSLVADFELAHGGLARTELDEQIAAPPSPARGRCTSASLRRKRRWPPALRRLPPFRTPRASRHWTSRSRRLCCGGRGRRRWRPWWRTRHGRQRCSASAHPRSRAWAWWPRRTGCVWTATPGRASLRRARTCSSRSSPAMSATPRRCRRPRCGGWCSRRAALFADFELAHGGLARTELDEQIARSPFTARGRCTSASLRRKRRWAPRAATPGGGPHGGRRRRGATSCLQRREPEARDERTGAALQRVGTPEEPRVGLVATTHRVRLDGDAWARVLEACPDLLKQEFTSDVCDATSLPPTSMRRLVLAAGSLVADFELAHGGLARTELDEQIARSPFTRTWALYQRVAAPEETLGPRAAPPAALQDSESFASLDVEEPPAVLRREGTPEVATMVAHEARAPALQRVGTPEEPRVGLVATTHRVRLDGDAWARVLEACPDLLKQEFTSDVCDATSLPPTSMRRLVLAAGSLDSESFASLDVEEPPAVLRREGTPEVATMVAHEARAPALQRVGTPEEPRVGLVATTHRVRLDGDAWARVLEACPDLLKQEFTSDVCDATSLPPTSMRRLVLAAGSLVADFELAHGGLARTELDEQIARSPFTRTWALYQRVAAPEETLAPRAATLEEAPMVVVSDVPAEHELSQRTAEPVGFSRDDLASAGPAALQRVGTPEEPRVGLVATTHRVRLDGDAWARVLEACPDLLKQEFTSDVCDATSLPPTSMRRLVLAAGSLVADFELAHGGLARTELDEQIARSPFTRTWALYQRVAAPEETLGPRAATLEEAPMVVVSDVPAEHELSQRTAEPVGFSRDDLASAGPAALQRVGTPEEPRVGLVATTHRVRLDGDAWARVLEACPDLLKQEFTSDVCDATSLPPTSMRRLVLAAGSLVADFELAHGGLARTELDEQIARSPFTRTWALYQRVAAPEETLAPALRRLPPFRTPRASRHWTSRSRRLCCGGRGRRRWRPWWRTRHGRQRCSASAHPRSRAWAWWPRRTGCVWTATPGRASLRRARTCSSRSSPAMSATPRRCRRPRCGGWCSRRAALLPTSSSRTAGWRGPSWMSRSPAPPSPARGRCTSASLRRKRRWPPRCDAGGGPHGGRERRACGARAVAAHRGAGRLLARRPRVSRACSAAARRHTRGAARGLGGHDAPGASGRRRLGARP
nr:unnamed protein product [Leishmania braziliensis]